MSRVVLMSDLDRTLIHPVKTVPDAWIAETQVVEIYEGRPITMAGHAALAGLESLADRGAFVPVTTRSRAQLQRITEVWGLVADGWAVCANGATILHGGVEDPEWRDEIARRCAASASVTEARGVFEREIGSPEATPWISLLRDCDERFLYATVDLATIPADLEQRAAAAMGGLGWRAVLHGRKLYVLPVDLCKGRAASWLRERLEAELVIGAGDSALDVELIATADVGWVPLDAELVHQDAVPATALVTNERHVRAGDQIVDAALHALDGRPGDPGRRRVRSA